MIQTKQQQKISWNSNIKFSLEITTMRWHYSEHIQDSFEVTGGVG